MSDARWPALSYEEWKDTYATLHMWAQVVGKVALAQAPPINDSWGIAMHRAASPRSRFRTIAAHSPSFIDSTYEAAADLAGWDRAALERRNARLA